MRAITKQVAGAFLKRERKSNGNTSTDGTGYRLHGNLIAEWRGNELWVTVAGWNTVTTRERLNGIGARVCARRGNLYLNDAPWNGDWAKIRTA